MFTDIRIIKAHCYRFTNIERIANISSKSYGKKAKLATMSGENLLSTR